MKLQFQFSGTNVSRPANHQRRHMVWVAFLGLVLLLGLGCWQYFSYLRTGSFLFFKRQTIAPTFASVAAPVTAPVPTTTSAPAPTPEASTQMPPALKKAAEDTIVSTWTRLAESVKGPTAPIEAVPTATVRTTPSAEPAAVQVIPQNTPVAVAPAKPRTFRPKPPETTEQRIQRAGQRAFESLLDQATKYPDAYGFLPDDAFNETTLGAAIPVYTIEEKDRHSYRNGQSVEPLLKSANQWVFPVYAGQRLCCMVQISYNGRDYIPGKASKFLAMAWNKIAERWPGSEGYHPHLVVNPAIPGFYFTIPELEMPNVTDTTQMFYLNPSLSPADVILASWR